MEAYCSRVGAQASGVRFLFDGNRISPDDTPGNVSNPPKKKFVFLFSLTTLIFVFSTSWVWKTKMKLTLWYVAVLVLSPLSYCLRCLCVFLQVQQIGGF